MTQPRPKDPVDPGAAPVRRRVRINTDPPLDGATPPAGNGGLAATASRGIAPVGRTSALTVGREVIFDVKDISLFYGDSEALADVTLPIHRNLVTAIIGPSGCGKSTFLRSLNRMNDSIPGVSVEGHVELDGEPIYGQEVDPVLVRRRVGMVFQRSNPFPKSIFENVAYGLRIA